MKNSTVLFVFLLVLMSCNSGVKNNDIYSIVDKTTLTADHPGKKLMETNCYICHSPTASHNERLAPPMEAIKRHYISDGISKTEFVASIQSWIKHPIKENAKMHGAVRRFGLMPKQIFPEKTIQDIADYMYTNDIEKPDWFDEHHSGN